LGTNINISMAFSPQAMVAKRKIKESRKKVVTVNNNVQPTGILLNNKILTNQMTPQNVMVNTVNPNNLMQGTSTFINPILAQQQIPISQPILQNNSHMFNQQPNLFQMPQQSLNQQYGYNTQQTNPNAAAMVAFMNLMQMNKVNLK
jgi:hypothetical protein